LPLQYSLTFVYLVYPMLPVSLDCPLLIALMVFSNVYLSCMNNPEKLVTYGTQDK
jgi:hypothetical protein